MSLIERIKGPRDIKLLSIRQLEELAGEIREIIIRVVSERGGHLASNLGVVELTLALHYCFDFSKDKLLWDVGHQCYVHKLITGRFDRFHTIRLKGGLSGFPDPEESEFDIFKVGHAGTAIGTALGIAKALELEGNHSSRVVSLVGDASIVNGTSFEALNNVGMLKRQFLIILNDNSMAIDITQGGLAGYLNKLRFTHTYEDMKRKVHELFEHFPGGRSVLEGLHHLKQGIKSVLSPAQIFEQLGLTYLGPIDGHNISLLIKAFDVVKDAPYPILLHVHTQKGKGFRSAVEEPSKFHSPGRFVVLNGDRAEIKSTHKTFTDVFSEKVVELAEKNPKIVAITAAMPDGTGLAAFKKLFPERYFDVGICEELAVTFAAGLAKEGFIPIVAIYSTFMQRAFDQIWQEVVLQRLPVIFCLDRAGLVGSDGPTHHGIFDIAYMRIMPDMVCIAAADEKELCRALDFAVELRRPVCIRYPKADIPRSGLLASVEDFKLGKSLVLHRGKDLNIVLYGALLDEVSSAIDMLKEEGIDVGLIVARFAKPIDKELFSSLLKEGRPLLTIEEHSEAGGFASALYEFAAGKGLSTDNLYRIAIPEDKFVPHATRSEQLEMLGLDRFGIYRKAKAILSSAEKVSTRDHIGPDVWQPGAIKRAKI